MKKNKNIKNINLKLSNFVMKLGMVSTVAGTVAASIGISETKVNKIVDHEDGESVQINQGNSKILPKDNQLTQLGINVIQEDGNDGFYVGGKNGLFEHFDSNGELLQPKGSKDKITFDITSITLNKNNQVLISGSNAAQVVMDSKGNILENLNLSDAFKTQGAVSKSFSSKNGQTYVAGTHGLVSIFDINGVELKTLNLGQDVNVNAMIETDDSIVLGTEQGGLFFINKITNEISSTQVNSPVVSIQTNEGGVFVQTQTKSLEVSNNNEILNSQDLNIFKNAKVTNIVSTKDGYIATGTKGHVALLDKSFKVISQSIALQGKDISSIVKDDESGFYIAGEKGLVSHINSEGVENSGEIKTLLDGSDIYGMQRNDEGHIFVFGNSFKVAELDNQGKTIKHFNLLGISSINTANTKTDGEIIFGGEVKSTKVWDTRIEEFFSSKDKTNTIPPGVKNITDPTKIGVPIISKNSIGKTKTGTQEINTYSYDFELQDKSITTKTIDTSSWNDASHFSDWNMGNFFKDKDGVFWITQVGKPLKKSIDGGINWIDQTQAGSKMVRGDGSRIIQTANGTIWVLGIKYIEKLVNPSDPNSRWETITNLPNKFPSVTPSGDWSALCKTTDKNGKEWVWVGLRDPKGASSLNVYKTSDEGKTWVLGGKNIKQTSNGFTIYQDSYKNTWVSSYGHKMQKSIDGGDSWTDVPESTINLGEATVFEDSHGTLWMGSMSQTMLQSTDKGKTWVSAGKWTIGKSFDCNLPIFEDSKGNVWALSSLGLQKYDYSVGKWVLQDKANSGSNILASSNGVIFEDSHGTLWAMGGNAPLQKLEVGSKTWIKDETSNIISGDRGFIAEDSHGNLISCGVGSSMQVKPSGSSKWVHSFNSKPLEPGLNAPRTSTGTQELKAAYKRDDGGILKFKSYLFRMEAGFKVQYSTDGGQIWKDANNTSKIDQSGSGSMAIYSGSLWASSSGHLQKTDDGITWTEEKTSCTLPVGEYFYKLIPTSQGLFFATSTVGLQVLAKGATTWVKVTAANGLKGDATKAAEPVIFGDSSGRVWYSVLGQPLQYTKDWKTSWTTSGSFVSSDWDWMAENSRGDLWYSTYKQGKLQRFHNNVWTGFDFGINNSLIGGRGSFTEDSHGNTWLTGQHMPLLVSTDKGDTWKIDTTSKIKEGYHAKIIEDSYGNLWSKSPLSPLQKWNIQTKTWEDVKESKLTTSNGPVQMYNEFGTLFVDCGLDGFQAFNTSPSETTGSLKSNNEFSGKFSAFSFIKDNQLYLNFVGLSKLLNIVGVSMEYTINGKNKQVFSQGLFPINQYGNYQFSIVTNSNVSITKNQLPKSFSIEFDCEVKQVPIIKPFLKQPIHNGDRGTMGYAKFKNPVGMKLQTSEDGASFKDADENGYSIDKRVGTLDFKWKMEDYYYWATKKFPTVRNLSIGKTSPASGDLDKNYEDIIESKVQHIFKDVNFDFKDWTADSFNALKSNTIKHIKLSNSTNDLTADLEVQIHADSEHKLSYKILKIQYDTKGTKISSDFYPVITKELMGAKGYITPSNDLNTQQEAQDKVLAKAKKEITDALGKMTFDKIHDTAYQALVKNLPATWHPVSEKVSLSHQDYKVEVKKTIDSKNGKIVLKINVFQPSISGALASDKIEIQGFLGLDSVLTKQTELEDRIKKIFGKTSGIDKLTTGVFNADLNNVTKKISIKGYAKTHLDLTVHIKATADDKLSYTIDPKVIIKDDNVDVKETLAQTIFSTVRNWHNDITVAPKFLSYADIKAEASEQTIEAELTKGLTKFEPSTKISIKVNDDYYLELVLDLSEASSTELRYEIDSFALKYKGNDLPDAQSSPELKSLIGLSEKMSVSSAIQGTFPTLEALKDLASKPIDSYVLEKFKYFDFQDWTVDSFNNQPANRTAKLRIYGDNDTSAELEISVTADSEKIISYKVTNVIVKEQGAQKTGGLFQTISDDFAAKSGQTQTHDDFRTEKEAQLKAADKAKDDMRIAIDKMTFDKAELPSQSEPKVFASWKGQGKYEAYHQEFDVTYKRVAKDSTGEIIVTSTVAPFTKTGPKTCTPESVTNTIGGFMGITQLTNMQSKVKQAILDKFAKQHLNGLTGYFFNKDPKNNVMEVAIGGFGDTTAELTLKLEATADDKLSYTVTDVVVKNGIKVVPDSIAGNAISELKKWTGDVDLNPGFLTEEEYEKNLVIKNFKANPNELASEVINAKNTGVSKAVKGEYEFENDDFRIDYTPDDETGEVLGKVTRKGSSSNVQETISGFLKFQAFVDAVTTKDLGSKLLSALDNYEDSKTFNFEINDDYALELTVAVLPKDDNTISYSVSGFDVKHNGKSLSDAQNSAILKALLKIKGDIKVPETNTKLLDVIYEKLHGESRRLDMSQLTKATSTSKPKPIVDLDEVTKELGEFYVSGEQSGSAKLLEKNNAPDTTGFEFKFQVMDDKKPLSEPTTTLPVNLKNGEHVKITSVLKDGYQVKGKMPEKDVAVKGLKEHTTVNAASLTKATEIKEVPEIKEIPEVAKPASKSNGLMIGLVVAGSVTGLILIGLLVLMIAKKRKKHS